MQTTTLFHVNKVAWTNKDTPDPVLVVGPGVDLRG